MVDLLVDVMGVDCTNKGVTSGKEKAILILDQTGVVLNKSDLPVLKLVPGRLDREWVAIPIDTNEKDYPMFGGHFIYTSDSRFPSDQPIHVHDRFEY